MKEKQNGRFGKCTMGRLSELQTFYRGKRVLITGHTGFKGGWLAFWLHALGAEIVGYALPPPTTPNFFEAVKLNKKIISVLGDIRNREMIGNIFKQHRPEIVFHMAAQTLVKHSYREPVETYETNVMGTVHILEACRTTPSVRAVVNITSDKCYENGNRKKSYVENDPMGGHDPYSSSKGCAELVTQAYIKSYFNPIEISPQHKCSLASGRAGNVIGGGDWADDRLIPDCIRAFAANKPVIIRYPDAIRPWQHVLEPLYGYLLLAQRLYKNGRAFSGGWNFGSNNKDQKTVRWVVERIIGLWGENGSWQIDPNNHPHEAPYLALDCSKARAKLGWFSRWDISNALEKCVAWYKTLSQNKDMSKITLQQITEYEQHLDT